MSDPLRTNQASLLAAERKWRKSMAQSDSTPPPPPQSSLAADDFAAFFDENIADIRSSFTSTATLPHSPSLFPPLVS
ncbi:hypothetical protein ANANG_G00264290, partial [Anguilla anguilla]